MSATPEAVFPPVDLPIRAGLRDTILARIHEHPILAVSSGIFALAILHTFLTPRFQKLSHELEKRDEAAGQPAGFAASLCHFLGEIEAVFGIWAVAHFLALAAWPGVGWKAAASYIDGRNYAEPVFVVIIMAMSATRPVVVWTGHLLGKIAALGKRTPLAWWFTLLTITPLLGSLITEPAAMTLAAMLLLRRVYCHNPSPAFSYGTLALLFVNVSVGGTLTNFAAPPVLMVASREMWDWSTTEMFFRFGLKSIAGIITVNIAYALLFRKEFATLKQRAAEADAIDAHDRDETSPPPFWILAMHLLFMAWTVEMLLLHHTALMVGGMLFFVAFTTATSEHQSPISLRSPLLVGFFLAGLVVHGGLQAWWIGPILGKLGQWSLFAGATGLTAFNDNAAITYLASQVGELKDNDALQYAVLAGAVTGGGLTVIANAPNPAGLAILARRFPDGVSPIKLFLWALPPTLAIGAVYMVLA